MKNNWTIYIVTDTGKEVPHWTEHSRKRAREKLRELKAAPHHPAVKFKLKKEGGEQTNAVRHD